MMHIECPSCQLANEIEYADNIVCSGCKESFAGHTYKKFKKPLISVFTAFAVGVYGMNKVDNAYFDEQRYPVHIEYELIDSCVNSSSRVLRSSQYITKKQACSCALEQTMIEIDYSELKKNESKFLIRFKSNIGKCT